MRNKEFINVLVVEDDDLDFDILERRLCTPNCGYRLIRARDLVEAHEASHSAVIDAGLIDYRLVGELNGLDFVRELGGREAPFPLIVLTGVDDAELDYEAILSGAYDYIDKMSLTREAVDRAIRFAISSRNYERRLGESIRDAQEQASVNRRILAVVSHEMHSPLRSIIGYCDYLSQQCGTDTTRDAASKMKAAAMHLEDFLRNLSEYVRLDSGAAHLIEEPVNIKDLVRETMDFFQPYAVHKMIRLEASFAGDVDTLIVGDRLRLRQVLINLLRNAIAFTDEGTIKVTAAFDDIALSIEVSDDGVGMSPEKIASIMDERPGLQTPGGALDSGLGIGLSICRRLLRLMGGRLSIESVLGFGTTVAFTVPTRRSSTAKAA